MIKKSSEEDYSQNPQFKAHVINLMSSINLAVNNLRQPEVVAAMMNKLGESHGRRKIQEEHFYVSLIHFIHTYLVYYLLYIKYLKYIKKANKTQL